MELLSFGFVRQTLFVIIFDAKVVIRILSSKKMRSPCACYRIKYKHKIRCGTQIRLHGRNVTKIADGFYSRIIIEECEYIALRLTFCGLIQPQNRVFLMVIHGNPGRGARTKKMSTIPTVSRVKENVAINMKCFIVEITILC